MLTNAAVLLALAVPAPVAAPVVVAPPVAPPATAVIDVLGFDGSGCPKDPPTKATQSPDRQAVTLTYTVYGVDVGPGLGVSASLQCDVAVQITPPAGYTSAVQLFDQRGSASLPAGATAEVSATYHSANSAPVVVNERLRAPLLGGWQTAHRIPTNRQVYGACGQPHFVFVRTKLTVAARAGVPADASVYSTDFSTNNLTWKRC